MTEEIKRILDNQKLINVENDYERIIFEYLANNCSEFDDEHIKQLVNLKVGQYKQSLEHITNLQQLYENALKVNQNTEKYRTELETKYVILQQENEKLKTFITTLISELKHCELNRTKNLDIVSDYIKQEYEKVLNGSDKQ